MDNSIELPEGIRLTGPGRGAADRGGHSRSIHDDPFTLWLCRHFAGIRALCVLQAKRIYGPFGPCYSTDSVGACMWIMPGGDNAMRAGDYLRFVANILLASGPGAMGRGRKTSQATEAHHPGFPHAYLFRIGVRRRARGAGLGRRLIASALDACDRTPNRANFANSNPVNTGFYASCPA